jgi:hypothetical protein
MVAFFFYMLEYARGAGKGNSSRKLSIYSHINNFKGVHAFTAFRCVVVSRLRRTVFSIS